jgi:hypothetical protein
VDPVPDPLLLRKSGSTGNLTLCNEKLSTNKFKPILFADVTNFIFESSKSDDFKNYINIVFVSLNSGVKPINSH